MLATKKKNRYQLPKGEKITAAKRKNIFWLLNGKKKKNLLPEERNNFRLLKGRTKVWLPKGGE